MGMKEKQNAFLLSQGGGRELNSLGSFFVRDASKGSRAFTVLVHFSSSNNHSRFLRLMLRQTESEETTSFNQRQGP